MFNRLLLEAANTSLLGEIKRTSIMNSLLERRKNIADSSFYLYNEAQIKNNIEKFTSIEYPSVKIHFASMANDNPVLLKMLQKSGVGLFVNSRKHLKTAFDCGFAPADVIYASTGVSEQTIKLLVEKGVSINIDSLPQLSLYGEINPGSKVGIRLNIDERSKNNAFTGLESRIGILESELDKVFEIADKHGLKLVGTHVYLGTDVTSLDDLMTGVEQTLNLSDRFPDLEFIDLGGGFPIEESRFDFEQYKSLICDKFENYSERRNKRISLILEPGRAVFGNAASFYTQVTDIKERPDRVLVCCNASASLIPRAMFYEDYNPVEPVDVSSEFYEKNVDIVGSTTYSRDYLAKGLKLSKVKVGDWLEFKSAGSYCYSMITRFLGQSVPPEYLATVDGHVDLIREGESFFGDDK